MKRTASIITIGTSALLLAAMPVFAKTTVSVSNNGEGSQTSVNVESNTGGNTICQNGKCETTSSNNGTSKVCVNGVCHTSEDGDVNYQSDDGSTKVNIQTNTDDSTVAVQNKEAGETVVVKPTFPPKPTAIQAVKGIADEKVADAKAEAEKRIKELEENKFDIFGFVKAEIDSFKGLLSKFGINI